METATSNSSPSRRGGWYFLSWTTYGTWLPGSPRGYVSPTPTPGQGWALHNRVGTPFDAGHPELVARAKSRMKGSRVVLTQRHALPCRTSTVETCTDHSLGLRAGAICPTHIHLVVHSPDAEGLEVLQFFKGAMSRRLSIEFGKPNAPTWWTRGGSRRLLPSDESLTGAIRYVLHEQSSALLVFSE